MRTAAQVVGLTCMLAWVSIDRSIWALVSGGICSALTEVIVSHARFLGPRQSMALGTICFCWKFFILANGFFCHQSLVFLLAVGIVCCWGSSVDTATLGVYVIAFLLFSSVEQVLATIIQSVAFPALSEIARKGASMKAGYYRLHAVIAAVAYFSGGFLIMSGQALVEILYDKRYMQAGWMLEIFSR